jgi:hypothetical protein
MQGSVPSQGVDGVQWHLPVHAIAVIVGFSVGLLFYCNLGPNAVPLWVTGLAYATPLAGASVLGLVVGKAPAHTPGDKRALGKFFLGCYVLAIGGFILSMARSDYAYADSLGWGIAQGYLLIWLPLAILLPALGWGMYVISGVSPWRRPAPYAAILLCATLIVVVLMPVPNSLTGEEVGPDTLGSPMDDDADVLLVFPLWQYYLRTTDIGFIGIVIQMWAGISMLGFGGLWSLARPESFRNAFAMHVEPTLAPPPPPETEPRLRLYG